MRPCMACNLMSFGDHTLDDSRPRLARVVDCALVDVDSGDEESGLRVGSFELIQHTFSIDPRPIIVGNSDGVWLGAVVDAFSTIWLVSELRTSNIASAASGWDLVGIAARAIPELAVGCLTIVAYG